MLPPTNTKVLAGSAHSNNYWAKHADVQDQVMQDHNSVTLVLYTLKF